VHDPIFVTGSTGFIGGALVRRLLDEGHQVHVAVRAEARRWRIEELEGHERLTIHPADLRDASQIMNAVAAAEPRTVVHLATHGAYEKQRDPTSILATNVLGTQNLLEASTQHGVALFVNAGSSSEYGFKKEPMRESDLPEPNSHYAVAKVAQTHLCRLAAKMHGMALVTFRLFSVYGPWEEPTRLIPTMIRRARAGLALEMANPAIARDFVYLDDVLDALTGFDALMRLRGEVINLGSGAETTLRDVVDAVLATVPSRSEVKWGAMADRKWDTDRWVSDPSLARELLGWRAKHDLREGLKKTSQWMLARKDQYGPSAA
jgi:nucleoside-diphosphate-sugar epimerase